MHNVDLHRLVAPWIPFLHRRDVHPDYCSKRQRKNFPWQSTRILLNLGKSVGSGAPRVALQKAGAPLNAGRTSKMFARTIHARIGFCIQTNIFLFCLSIAYCKSYTVYFPLPEMRKYLLCILLKT
jgi:hypothetical protein